MRTFTNVRFVRFFLFAVILGCLSAAAFAQVGIAISFGPPALPIYEQPPCPQEGYMWTPGYWAYDYDISDYYWVPGTWIEFPEVGFLWTPGYWGWNGGGFIFNEGYWGPHVGFYGGISYGYGYFGEGYEGGRWDNGRFFYNRSVNNVNVTNIHNVYNTTVINNTTTINRVSYNGGNGGLNARPRAEDEIASRDRRVALCPPRHNICRLLVRIRKCALPKTAANLQSRPRPEREHSPTAQWPPAKEAGAPYTPPLNGRGRPSPANAETPRPQSNGGFAGAEPMPKMFSRTRAPIRQIPAMRRPTRNTNNNSRSFTRSRSRTAEAAAETGTRPSEVRTTAGCSCEKSAGRAKASTTDAANGTKTYPATGTHTAQAATAESQ